MMDSLQSGVSGLQQFQLAIDVIGNNIANVNTTGYKSAEINFADTFSRTLASSGSGETMQVGTGVTTSSIRNQFTAGSVSPTGNPLDLAITGSNGFFIVNDSSGIQYATRAGEFHTDKDGYLLNQQNYRVQGFTDTGLSARGDIKIDATGATGAAANSTISQINIGTDGKIKVRLSDGTEFVRGQVLLQNFTSPQNLQKEGANLWSGIAAAGPMSQTEAPGTKGLSQIKSGALEMSNVDLAGEMASLITTQRAFQANARIVTTSDEVLQEIVNLKR